MNNVSYWIPAYAGRTARRLHWITVCAGRTARRLHWITVCAGRTARRLHWITVCAGRTARRLHWITVCAGRTARRLHWITVCAGRTARRLHWITVCAGRTARRLERPGTDLKSVPRGSESSFRRMPESSGTTCRRSLPRHVVSRGRLLILFPMLWSATAVAQEAPATGPYCPVVFHIPDKPVVDVELEEGDTYINAERIDLLEHGVSELEGSVEMITDTWSARADEAIHNDAGNYVDLSGDVKFWEESLYLDGDRAHIDLDNSTTTVNEAQYYIPENNAWGEAEELFIDPGILTSGKEMAFTTCTPENGGGIEENFWKISARELNLNHQTNRGSGRGIVLKIKDIPVFYAPYFTFPLSRDRKSGFLAPGIGKNSHGGFETRLPYYWNISPSMDATITPRVLANSGVMGMLEYRYLFKHGQSRLNLEYLPGDVGFDDRDRSMINFEHTQSFLDRGRLSVIYNRASDPEYLEDFGAELAVSSTRYLPRRADLTYRGSNWNVLARLHSYQVVDRTIAVTSRPYKNLPSGTVQVSAFDG